MVYLTRILDFTLRVSDCEELVGVDQGAKYETLLFALIHKHIKNNRGAPKGGFASWKKASAIIIIAG